MRKFFIFIILIFTTINITFAYTPTENENKLLLKLQQNTIEKTKTKGDMWLRRYISSLENSYKKTKDERIKYLLNIIIINDKEILKKSINQKQEILQKQKLESENKYKLEAKDFFEIYGKEITTGLEINDKCTKYFDLIDEIAQENNFPTELIIATWSIEYNCNLSNPNNGWGPFQIKSGYYEPGELSIEEFKETILDYIDFSKRKWDYFNNNTYHDYKSRFGSDNMNINYNKYTFRDIKLNSILYNGIKSDTTLDGNTFANANLNNEVVSNIDGLVTRFLKILYWRINR